MLIANSTSVAERIRRWWGRESTVVHPPVAVHRFQLDSTVPREDFFLLAGRLVPYKRPDIAIRAAAKAGVRLVVAGDGRSRTYCESIAGPEVSFLGPVSEEQLLDLYRRCRALLFPGVEDFGIVPVEAQACGTPVIGLDEGGLRDTVVPGRTGILVQNSSLTTKLVNNFADAIRSSRVSRLNPHQIRVHAEKFSERKFKIELQELVERLADGGEERRPEIDLRSTSRGPRQPHRLAPSD